MDNQHNQQMFGHPASISTAPVSMDDDSIYQMNPNVSIHPINEVTPNSNERNASMPQAPVFYDQPGIYPEMSIGGNNALSDSNRFQQSYNIQPQQHASFQQHVLSNPQQPAHMTMNMATTPNEMYHENPSGAPLSSPITNMLSFQPLPQQTSNIFHSNTATKPIQNTQPQPVLVPQNVPNIHPSFQATTPPPLSHLQGVSVYEKQSQIQQSTYPVPSSTPMSGGNTESNPAFKTPKTKKTPKTRSPKKKVLPNSDALSTNSTELLEASQVRADSTITPPDEVISQGAPISHGSTPINQGVASFPKLKNLVGRLLSSTLDAFTDKDFGEKTLMNLARKLSSASISTNEESPVLQTWENAIARKEFRSGCVCIQRPREGRITVTKSGTGNSGSKKVFPQIVLCQMFRFPNIVFHHDIKSSEYCQNPSAVKPNIILPGGSESSEIASEVDGGASDLICLNPYHYLVSPEGMKQSFR